MRITGEMAQCPDKPGADWPVCGPKRCCCSAGCQPQPPHRMRPAVRRSLVSRLDCLSTPHQALLCCPASGALARDTTPARLPPQLDHIRPWI